MVVNVLKMKKKTPKVSFWKVLSKIFGIGASTGKRLCIKSGFTENIKCFEVSNKKAKAISDFINDNLIVNLELGALLKSKKDLHVNAETYKGLRYALNLPVNGQRTRSNASIGKKFRVEVSDKKSKKELVKKKRPQFFPKI